MTYNVFGGMLKPAQSILFFPFFFMSSACLLSGVTVVIFVCMCVCRIDSLTSALFLGLLNVLSAWPCHMAGSLLASILQGQETHRVVHLFLLPSDECAVVLLCMGVFCCS